MAKTEYAPGQVVRVTGGKYKGEAGQVRGQADKGGNLPLMIAGKVHRIAEKNIGGGNG